MNKIGRNDFIGKKERSIWKNLGLALVYTPVVTIVGLVIITLFGALDYAITKVQSAGYWWLLLIVGYIISLVYVICEPKIRLNHERKKVVNALILYWEEQLENQNKLPKSGIDIELLRESPLERIKVLALFERTRESLLERIKVGAWFDPELWNEYFPDEKYSKYLFGIVDNFIAHLEHMAKKYGKK